MPESAYERGRQAFLAGRTLTHKESWNKEMRRGWVEAMVDGAHPEMVAHLAYERGRERFLTGGILNRDEARNKEFARGWNEAFDEEQAEREKRHVPGQVPHVFRHREEEPIDYNRDP